ncbi:uncharacterized protein Triagg1_2519 [Trichoderma aggressivum f. europaeum]|uniref:Uncharacterized protein n=1 Tax=Trichoderma aggressivum f. europaeum TaxID=173218 RepID=A0AAE1IH65_9HYPO|nr:hypothetical protein Triagg1_2519 [Trichoderma aggressivum f. europaeum]
MADEDGDGRKLQRQGGPGIGFGPRRLARVGPPLACDAATATAAAAAAAAATATATATASSRRRCKEQRQPSPHPTGDNAQAQRPPIPVSRRAVATLDFGRPKRWHEECKTFSGPTYCLVLETHGTQAVQFIFHAQGWLLLFVSGLEMRNHSCDLSPRTEIYLISFFVTCLGLAALS